MEDLLPTLRELEASLHRPDVRQDKGKLDALLHDSFIEFGRSGNSYTKADILRFLPNEDDKAVIWSQDFAAKMVSEDVALLTYRSAHIGPDGELFRHALRSSLWKRGENGWQIWFHQGTATVAFTKKTQPVVARPD